MSRVTINKDPDERIDIDFDYERWLVDSDTIVSADTEINKTTATIDQKDVSDTVVKVWVTGGTHPETGSITVRATTAQGRIKEQCARLKIRNC